MQGHVVVVTDEAAAPGGAAARSRDHLGNTYEWRPHMRVGGVRWAIDVERMQGRIPPLAPQWDEARFLAVWTRAEVIAKLRNIPISILWRALGTRCSAGGGPFAYASPSRQVIVNGWREGPLLIAIGCMKDTGHEP